MEARFRPVHISIRIPLSLHMRTAVYALWGTPLHSSLSVPSMSKKIALTIFPTFLICVTSF